MPQAVLKTMIIDDQIHCIEYLSDCISKYCPEVEIIKSFTSFHEGVKQITSTPPDLLFLDIEMPEGSGFDLLAYLEKTKIKVVFTTAHEQYAIEAIRAGAIDYLLKPVQPDELRQCINRLVWTMDNERFLDLKKGTDKIPLSSQHGIVFCEPQEIVRCAADGSYTKIFTLSKMFIISKSIKSLDQLLRPYSFFRVHRSHIINLNHINEYIRGNGGIAIMSDGSRIDISKRKREDFLRALV